jgi:esterase/lipase superfamily enzyme
MAAFLSAAAIVNGLADGSAESRFDLRQRIMRDATIDRGELSTVLRAELCGRFAPASALDPAIRDPRKISDARSWMLSALIWSDAEGAAGRDIILRHLEHPYEPDPGVRFWALAELQARNASYLPDAVKAALTDPEPSVSGLARALLQPDDAGTIETIRAMLHADDFAMVWAALRILRVVPLEALAPDLCAMLDGTIGDEPITYDVLYALSSPPIAAAAASILTSTVGVGGVFRRVLLQSRAAHQTPVPVFAVLLGALNRAEVDRVSNDALAESDLMYTANALRRALALPVARSMIQQTEYEADAGLQGHPGGYETAEESGEDAEPPQRLVQPRRDGQQQQMQEAQDRELPSRPATGNYAVQPVYFATDRALKKAPSAEVPDFTSDRAPRGDLSYGRCDVSIPRSHEVGKLESPSIWRLEFREDPERHVVLVSGALFPEADTFFDHIDTGLAARDLEDQRLLVFVHGYNVSFKDAVRRTGQLSYDLDYGGVPITYSWPSRGELLGYVVDENNIEWTTPHLEAFLAALQNKTRARKIDVVAHSMGNRAVTRALTNLALHGSGVRLTNVVLAAPDIDREIFLQLADALAKTADTVTLYASSRDRALQASKKINGYPRAGDTGEDIVVRQPIQTVDVSALDTDFLGHGYVAGNTTIVSDLYWLLRGRVPPRFRLKAGTNVNGQFWRFIP